MEQELLSFAGFGAAVVIGAAWMLRFIMSRLSKLEDDYRTVVSNHIAHSTEAMNGVRDALHELTEAIRAQMK